MAYGSVIKWIAVFFLSVFDGVWLFVIWQSIRERGYANGDGDWIDRGETPFKFWLGMAFLTTFVLGAIAFTVFIATRHWVLSPIPQDGPPIDSPPMSIVRA